MQAQKQNPIFQKNEPKKVSKQDLIGYLRTAQKNGEISWLITDTKSFEWSEINSDKKKFLSEITSLKFKKAHVGIFYSTTKNTEYASFELQ